MNFKDSKKLLNLYLFLSGANNLNRELENLLLDLEKNIFEEYSVMEIESYRKEFNSKGIV